MARSPRTERRGAALAVAWIGVAMAAVAAQGADDDERRLAFERRGAVVASRELGVLRQAVAPATVRVFEPYEGREVAFRALPFDRVLDAVYGPGWRSEEEVLFRCRDGYQPSVPAQRFREHRAWLAFDRADQEGFTIRKLESGEWKTVELGPFYLVWENLDDAQVRQEGDYGWPYQVVEVDLIRTLDRFGAMTPAEGATPEVQAGFSAFRAHCSRCHQLFGQGGRVGPELDPSAVRARDPDWLRAWIEDPSRVAPTARMEALNPALPDRERVVEQIIAYLTALAEAG